jgi:hypothetical protein
VENTNDPHPGDANVAMQDMFLADMKRIIDATASTSRHQSRRVPAAPRAAAQRLGCANVETPLI